VNCPLKFAAVAVLAALLAACNAIEPYDRAHTWHLTGANEANLAAMVDDPTDLAHGRSASATDGQAAASPIDRLRHDRVKPLSGDSSGAAAPNAAAGLTAN
jgi:type IV pilus biogenesis protein CpaD/CtpE